MWRHGGTTSMELLHQDHLPPVCPSGSTLPMWEPSCMYEENQMIEKLPIMRVLCFVGVLPSLSQWNHTFMSRDLAWVTRNCFHASVLDEEGECVLLNKADIQQSLVWCVRWIARFWWFQMWMRAFHGFWSVEESKIFNCIISLWRVEKSTLLWIADIFPLDVRNDGYDTT